MSKWFSIFGKH